MTRPVSIGIDLATSSARVVAVDFSDLAEIVAEVSKPLSAPDYGDGGRARQLPSYAQVVRELLGELVTRGGLDTAKVGSVSVTATSGTLIGVDATGQPVGDALLYSDTSGGAWEKIISAADHQGRPTASLNRIRQILHEYPAASVVTSADLVNAMLTGNPRLPSDTSHTLKAGVDPTAMSWPDATLEALGCETGALPDLVAPGEILGTLDSSLVAEWGFPAECVVVAGMTDGCTSQIATGGIAPGDTVGVLGTTLVLKAVSASDIRNPDLGIYSHQGPDGTFFPGGASNVGGASLPEGLGPDDIVVLTEQSVSRGISPHLVYPLPRPGERFPFSHPRAVALGMDRQWDRDEKFHAVIQAIAMTERLGREVLADQGVTLARHLVSGGGAGSLAMTTLRATVLGEAVTKPRFTDSAVGAAMLAAQAVSGLGLTEFSDRHQQPGVEVEPVAKWIPAAHDAYQRFVEMLGETGYLSSPNSV